MRKTRFDSFRIGNLSKACQMCVKGQKSVLFITGLCSRRCDYCPISDDKKRKDKIYINEWKTQHFNDIIKEIKLCNSKGVGITGGDPLCTLNKTLSLIKLLKHIFGKKFHIHLYTTLVLINRETLEKLYKAGLDEIRFHPDIFNSKHWNKLKLANQYRWKMTLEIPVFPDKLEKTKELIAFAARHIHYLNLNELEMADNSSYKLRYKTKDDLSYAIKDSVKTGKVLMYFAKKQGIRNIHLCTATTKDKHQLKNRIKKRAKNIRLNYDKMTKEGTLIRYAIYPKKLLKRKDPTDTDIIKLKKIKKEIDLLENNQTYLDIQFGRIIISKKIIDKHIEKLRDFHIYKIEEYPTYDAFPVEIEELLPYKKNI